LSKQKVLKSSLGRKSEDCPDPNETVDESTNHELPDVFLEFFDVHAVLMPVTLDTQVKIIYKSYG